MIVRSNLLNKSQRILAASFAAIGLGLSSGCATINNETKLPLNTQVRFADDCATYDTKNHTTTILDGCFEQKRLAQQQAAARELKLHTLNEYIATSNDLCAESIINPRLKVNCTVAALTLAVKADQWDDRDLGEISDGKNLKSSSQFVRDQVIAGKECEFKGLGTIATKEAWVCVEKPDTLEANSASTATAANNSSLVVQPRVAHNPVNAEPRVDHGTYNVVHFRKKSKTVLAAADPNATSIEHHDVSYSLPFTNYVKLTAPISASTTHNYDVVGAGALATSLALLSPGRGLFINETPNPKPAPNLPERMPVALIQTKREETPADSSLTPLDPIKPSRYERLKSWAHDNSAGIAAGMASGAAVKSGLGIAAKFALAKLAITLPAASLAATTLTTITAAVTAAATTAPILTGIVSAAALGLAAGGVSELAKTYVNTRGQEREKGWWKDAFVRGSKVGAVFGGGTFAILQGIETLLPNNFFHNLIHSSHQTVSNHPGTDNLVAVHPPQPLHTPATDTLASHGVSDAHQAVSQTLVGSVGLSSDQLKHLSPALQSAAEHLMGSNDAAKLADWAKEASFHLSQHGHADEAVRVIKNALHISSLPGASHASQEIVEKLNADLGFFELHGKGIGVNLSDAKHHLLNAGKFGEKLMNYANQIKAFRLSPA